MYRKRLVRIAVRYLTKYANAIRYRFILLILLMMFPVVSNASFHFKNLGVSVFPAFSTDGLRRWFNTKFEADWHINDLMELETIAIFLRINNSHTDENFFKEIGLWGVQANLKFKLPANLYAGAGVEINFTNFCHYDLDETYMKFQPSVYFSLEYKIPWDPKILATDKIGLMYYYTPIDLRDTSFGEHYHSHILMISISFEVFRGQQ